MNLQFIEIFITFNLLIRQYFIQITVLDPGGLSSTESIDITVYDTYLSGDVIPFVILFLIFKRFKIPW